MRESDDISEKFLMQQFIQGNEKAFDAVFRKYYKLLCARAVIYIKDNDRAQSIVQDCFVSLWEKRHSLGTIEKLHPFLATAVRNKALDFLRKEASESKLIDALKVSEGEVLIDNMAITLEFEEQLMTAISMLPDRCREAFQYSRFEGMTYSEIAVNMNISVKAVEALIGRSLKLLRREMIDYLPLFVLLFIK
ncbi:MULTISPECIES: RNA polymerase sigma-70 factor [unclassified Carboxylicivirga]|uniref:RNA polymerase sigma-70 factor n=1 Tax=Carboxylicivirga TaxID=1628153 RepID=UPI003D349111